MRESDIERSLEDKVRKAGGLTYKFCSPNNPGVPDRIVISSAGKIIFVELKTEIGRLARIQDWQIRRMRELGCDVRILKGMKDVRDFVKEVFTNEIQTASIPGVCDGHDPEPTGCRVILGNGIG